MFLNAALGDQSLFVSADELVEMWRIFTPLLHQIDEQRPEVVIYPFGMVPTGWAEWAQARGAAPKSTWQEFLALHSDQVEELRKVFVELDVNGKGRRVAWSVQSAPFIERYDPRSSHATERRSSERERCSAVVRRSPSKVLASPHPQAHAHARASDPTSAGSRARRSSSSPSASTMGGNRR